MGRKRPCAGLATGLISAPTNGFKPIAAAALMPRKGGGAPLCKNSRMIQRARDFYREHARDFIAQYWLVLLACAIALALAFKYVNPAPPNTIHISTGTNEGTFTLYAERYKKVLARDGVTLVLRPSAGSAQNLARLLDDGAGIEAGFIQGGMVSDGNGPQIADKLLSLGSMYYEPLWVFVRLAPEGAVAGAQPAANRGKAAARGVAKSAAATSPSKSAAAPPATPTGPAAAPTKLSELKGLRIAAGVPGGGTSTLALRLLTPSGVSDSNSTLLPLSGASAAAALLEGRADAALFLTTLDTPHIQQLLATPGFALMHLDQADAMIRNFPFLHRLTLPQGSFDLERNIPLQDVALLAPTVKIAVRADLHPALVTLLLKAATEVHGAASLLQKEREFPLGSDTEIALSPDAQRYYKSGPPFLQKYLPFWAATWVDRMFFILLPILAILIPVTRIAPAVYAWRIRAKVYHWYGELKFLEGQLRNNPATARLPGYLERLDWIEDQVNRIRLPLAFSNHVYFLREHIELVRNAIVRAAPKAA